jgi:hypothetical protein
MSRPAQVREFADPLALDRANAAELGGPARRAESLRQVTDREGHNDPDGSAAAVRVELVVRERHVGRQQPRP